MQQAPPASGADPARLDALEARLDRIERAVDRLTGAVDALPGLLAMGADSADEAIAQVERRSGVLTEERLEAVTEALLRLSEPRTLGLLQRGLDLAGSAEPNLAMALDAADAWVAGLQTPERDPEQRIADLSALATALTAPRTLALAQRAFDHIDALERLFDVLLAAPDTVGMVLDVADELLRQAERQGLELDLLLDRGVQVLLRAGRLAGSDELQELIDSSVLSADAVRTVSLAANALAASRAEAPGRAGPWAALRALSDPQIQAALDFAIRFGRRFGASIGSDADLPATR